jgi:hypothetical protein
MMNLFASVFAGVGILFGGMFGHHAVMHEDATSTPPGDHGDHMMGSTTPEGNHRDDMMGSTTPAVIGKVVSISGTTLTVTGRSADNATTTYTVDASAAKFMKGKQTATSTPLTISTVSVGDSVLVIGTVSGTSVTAKVIINGLPPQKMMNPSMKPGMHMGSTTVMHRSQGNGDGNNSDSKGSH